MKKKFIQKTNIVILTKQTHAVHECCVCVCVRCTYMIFEICFINVDIFIFSYNMRCAAVKWG